MVDPSLILFSCMECGDPAELFFPAAVTDNGEEFWTCERCLRLAIGERMLDHAESGEYRIEGDKIVRNDNEGSTDGQTP